MIRDHGYVFLFNPNYKELIASFQLDSSIGLRAGDTFFCENSIRVKAELIGKAGAGVWRFGDAVSYDLEGPVPAFLKWCT